MGELFGGDAARFCMNIMEKLNQKEVGSAEVVKVLADTCTFFGFSQGFIYYPADRDRSFSGSVVSAENIALPDRMPVRVEFNIEPDRDILKEIARQQLVTPESETVSDELDQSIQELLQVRDYVLFPVLDEQQQIIALLGMGEKEWRERKADINDSAVYSVFAIISNHVKVNLYLHSIRQTEKALAGIADNMGVDIYVNDFFTHEVLYVNESMAVPYGGAGKMIGKTCWQVLYDDKTEPCEYCPQKKLIDDEGNPTKIYSWDYQRPFDQAWFRVLSAAFRWDDGRMAHIVSSIDITDNKQKAEVIQTIAEYDTLTNLYNRRKLYADCEQMIADKARLEQSFHVLFFDLNKFKQVNDRYGHRAGDELLSKIGAYLRNHRIYGNYTYRYGGDEFVIIFPDGSKEEVMAAAEELRQHFLKPWELEAGSVFCPASIGVAAYPMHGTTAEELFQNADTAMYKSKSWQGNIIVYYL